MARRPGIMSFDDFREVDPQSFSGNGAGHPDPANTGPHTGTAGEQEATMAADDILPGEPRVGKIATALVDEGIAPDGNSAMEMIRSWFTELNLIPDGLSVPKINRGAMARREMVEHARELILAHRQDATAAADPDPVADPAPSPDDAGSDPADPPVDPPAPPINTGPVLNEWQALLLEHLVLARDRQAVVDGNRSNPKWGPAEFDQLDEVKQAQDNLAMAIHAQAYPYLRSQGLDDTEITARMYALRDGSSTTSASVEAGEVEAKDIWVNWAAGDLIRCSFAPEVCLAAFDWSGEFTKIAYKVQPPSKRPTALTTPEPEELEQHPKWNDLSDGRRKLVLSIVDLRKARQQGDDTWQQVAQTHAEATLREVALSEGAAEAKVDSWLEKGKSYLNRITSSSEDVVDAVASFHLPQPPKAAKLKASDPAPPANPPLPPQGRHIVRSTDKQTGTSGPPAPPQPPAADDSVEDDEDEFAAPEGVSEDRYRRLVEEGALRSAEGTLSVAEILDLAPTIS